MNLLTSYYAFEYRGSDYQWLFRDTTPKVDNFCW